MEKKTILSELNPVLVAGAVWGISEALMGAWLNGCAFRYSGAIMTGLAFFYMSFTWSMTRKLLSILLLLAMVVLFKMFDAVLLSVSLSHGSVLNPSFAFLTESLAFMAVVLLIGGRFFNRQSYRVLTGAAAALLAVCLFPFAGYFTGSAACLYPGTQIPLSIATSPLAMAISVITVPLGHLVARLIRTPSSELKNITAIPALGQLWPSLVVMLCIAILAISRAG